MAIDGENSPFPAGNLILAMKNSKASAGYFKFIAGGAGWPSGNPPKKFFKQFSLANNQYFLVFLIVNCCKEKSNKWRDCSFGKAKLILTMKNMKLPVDYFRWIVGAATIVAIIYMASIGTASAGGTNVTAAAVSVSKPADIQTKPAKNDPPPERKITGVELYAIHCNRCHPERYPTEFNEAEWKTIMMHMRVRANLPGDQAREIMQYLREESGN